jgi:hypothetical protein
MILSMVLGNFLWGGVDFVRGVLRRTEGVSLTRLRLAQDDNKVPAHPPKCLKRSTPCHFVVPKA